MLIGLCIDARFAAHVPPADPDRGAGAHPAYGHPENPGRLAAIDAELAQRGLFARTTAVAARAATRAELERVHTAAYLDALEVTILDRREGWLDPDTYYAEGSFDAALLAAGAAIDCALAVVDGKLDAAFAIVRPPGHHATADRAMGFCLVNNVAVGARAAQRRHGAVRVAILDIDVHHGNGTQEVFIADPDVLFCSLHQWPLYPFSGRAGERGEGRGAGATLNVPLPPGTDGDSWLRAFDEQVAPAVRAHAPELLLVSAGFDAHEADPLAQMALHTETYAAIAGRIDALAVELCGGRTVWALEGGYDLEALPASVATVVRTLDASG